MNVFKYDRLKVFFKHTDFYGSLHPYNFFEWTSYVREAFFSEQCGDFRALLESPVKMMTAKIELKLLDDSLFGDDIEALFSVTKIKKVSFDVIVKFRNKRLDKVTAITRHTLVFVDAQKERFTQVPESIKQSVVNFEETMR